jgi:hypothetical protein
MSTYKTYQSCIVFEINNYFAVAAAEEVNLRGSTAQVTLIFLFVCSPANKRYVGNFSSALFAIANSVVQKFVRMI